MINDLRAKPLTTSKIASIHDKANIKKKKLLRVSNMGFADKSRIIISKSLKWTLTLHPH